MFSEHPVTNVFFLEFWFLLEFRDSPRSPNTAAYLCICKEYCHSSICNDAFSDCFLKESSFILNHTEHIMPTEM